MERHSGPDLLRAPPGGGGGAAGTESTLEGGALLPRCAQALTASAVPGPAGHLDSPRVSPAAPAEAPGLVPGTSTQSLRSWQGGPEPGPCVCRGRPSPPRLCPSPSHACGWPSIQGLVWRPVPAALSPLSSRATCGGIQHLAEFREYPVPPLGSTSPGEHLRVKEPHYFREA